MKKIWAAVAACGMHGGGLACRKYLAQSVDVGASMVCARTPHGVLHGEVERER
ncbi:MAG TPA: hypothetical protein VGL08_08755 [Paraburkholderia sp.]|jgi:hypothetical protein